MSEEEIIEALNKIAAHFREQHLCGYEHVVNAVALIVQQQSQIARVREVCDLWQRRHDSSIRHPADIPAVAIVAVLRALDGDGDA